MYLANGKRRIIRVKPSRHVEYVESYNDGEGTTYFKKRVEWWCVCDVSKVRWWFLMWVRVFSRERIKDYNSLDCYELYNEFNLSSENYDGTVPLTSVFNDFLKGFHIVKSLR